MWLLIVIAVFVIGGIIYKMGETNNDTSRVMDGAAEGGCLLVALLQFFAPFIIIVGIIVFIVKSCS